MKIRKNDTVKIISGKDRGKTGKVVKVFPKHQRIVVEGVALKKRHERPRKTGQKGQVVQVGSWIDASNTMIVCKSCKKEVRVGFNTIEGKKIRVCKKCGSEI